MEFLLKKYLFEVETDDSLNWINQDKIFGGYDEDRDIETIRVEDQGNWEGESAPMEIEEMENILHDFKRLGATHIEVMYHEDHGSYIFNAVKMRKATKQEIGEYLGKEEAQEKLEKEQEIAKLEEKLRKLKEE